MPPLVVVDDCSLVVDTNDDDERRIDGRRIRNLILYPLTTYIIQTNDIDPTARKMNVSLRDRRSLCRKLDDLSLLFLIHDGTGAGGV